MSYYIKDANNVVHSASPEGSANPFTAAVKFESILEPHTLKDYGGDQNEIEYLVYNLPIIVIKDGSKPIYNFSDCVNLVDTANNFTDTAVRGYPWIGNFVYESNNNQYIITNNIYGSNVAATWAFSNKYVSNKEIYAGDKAFISLVDRNKGNLLEWQLIDKNIINTYWNTKYGPWEEDNIIKDNGYLRGSNSYESNADVPSKSVSYYTFNSDLFDGSQDFNFKAIKAIRSIPERIENNKFSYIEHIEKSNDTNGNPISYFTLNVNDIINEGYTKLKLGLHYNILFNSTYVNHEPQDVNKIAINNQNCCDSHPFIFNYHLSNSAKWDNREGADGKCEVGFNLDSTIVKENGTWKAKDTDTHTLYTYNMFNNKTDPWGDVNTYRKLFATKISTTTAGSPGIPGNFPYLNEIKFLGINRTYYSCGDYSNVGNYDSTTQYKKYDVIKQNNTLYVSLKTQTNVSPKDNNSTSPSYSTNPSSAPWYKMEIIPCNHNYETEFGESGFLGDKDENKWGIYSGNFIPYFITNSRDFYFDSCYGFGYNITSTLNEGVTGWLKTKVWTKEYMPTFISTNTYLSGNSNEPNFISGNKVCTDLKYNYIGYINSTNENRKLSKVIYTLSNDDKIYFNDPYRTITQYNMNPYITDETTYHKVFYVFDPVSNLVYTPGSYIKSQDFIDLNWGFIYTNNRGKTFITQLINDIYLYPPDFLYDATVPGSFLYLDSTNVIYRRRIISNNVVVDGQFTIRGIFGDENASTKEKNQRYFFIDVTNADNAFNTNSNYDCSSNGQTYRDGQQFKTYILGTNLYAIFKNYPYLGNVPQSGEKEQSFYTYSSNDYYFVEDKNNYINITNSFLTTSYINRITDYYSTGWNNATRYNKFDCVYDNNYYYYANVDNTNCPLVYNSGPAPYSKDNVPEMWNESGYSLYNSKTIYSALQNYKNYNLRGDTEYIIDLSNTDKQYIHIAYPSTTLLDSDNNSGKFPESACHTFITDLKMTYEGVE